MALSTWKARRAETRSVQRAAIRVRQIRGRAPSYKRSSSGAMSASPRKPSRGRRTVAMTAKGAAPPSRRRPVTAGSAGSPNPADGQARGRHDVFAAALRSSSSWASRRASARRPASRTPFRGRRCRSARGCGRRPVRPRPALPRSAIQYQRDRLRPARAQRLGLQLQRAGGMPRASAKSPITHAADAARKCTREECGSSSRARSIPARLLLVVLGREEEPEVGVEHRHLRAQPSASTKCARGPPMALEVEGVERLREMRLRQSGVERQRSGDRIQRARLAVLGRRPAVDAQDRVAVGEPGVASA